MSVVFDENRAHCSAHVYFSGGCGECSTAELLRLQSYQVLTKKDTIHSVEIKVGDPSAHLQMIRQQLNTVFRVFLANAAVSAANAIESKTEKVNKNFDELAAEAQAAFDSIKWDDLVDDVASDLSAAVQVGGLNAVAQLELDMHSQYETINTAAANYANHRAAEMIGKKYVGGVLVDSSNADYVISETTRQDIRDIVENSFLQNSSLSEIKEKIRTAGTFSAKRAQLIAKTEIAMAQVQGNLAVWKSTGFVKSVNILLSGNHQAPDICDALVENGPYDIDHIPMIPAHPSCECIIAADEISQG